MKGASRGLEGGLRRASRGLQGGLRRASRGLEKGFKGASRGLQALLTFVPPPPGKGPFKPPLKGTFEGGGSDPAPPLRLGPQRVGLAFASDATSGCKPEFSHGSGASAHA